MRRAGGLRRTGPATGLVTLGLLVGAASVVQDGPPTYLAVDLTCAAFRETVRTATRLQGPGGRQEETLSRDGVLSIRSRPEPPALRLEAWYDSLTLRRDGPLGLVVPDTDGLIGGRWRVTLDARGAARIQGRPFIPDEVRQAGELSDLLLDFFPALAPVPLAVGDSWRDSSALEIQRLADSTAGGRALPRFTWRRSAYAPGDSLPVRGQRHDDQGTVVWDPERGPLAWTRRVVINAELRGTGTGPWIRSRVEQRVDVQRLASAPGCR